MIFRDIIEDLKLLTTSVMTLVEAPKTTQDKVSAIINLHLTKFNAYTLLYDEINFKELYQVALLNNITEIINGVKQETLTNANLLILEDFAIKNINSFDNESNNSASTGYDATSISTSFSGSKSSGTNKGNSTSTNSDYLTYLFKFNETFLKYFTNFDDEVMNLLQIYYGAN